MSNSVCGTLLRFFTSIVSLFGNKNGEGSKTVDLETSSNPQSPISNKMYMFDTENKTMFTQISILSSLTSATMINQDVACIIIGYVGYCTGIDYVLISEFLEIDVENQCLIMHLFNLLNQNIASIPIHVNQEQIRFFQDPFFSHHVYSCRGNVLYLCHSGFMALRNQMFKTNLINKDGQIQTTSLEEIKLIKHAKKDAGSSFDVDFNILVAEDSIIKSDCRSYISQLQSIEDKPPAVPIAKYNNSNDIMLNEIRKYEHEIAMQQYLKEKHLIKMEWKRMYCPLPAYTMARRFCYDLVLTYQQIKVLLLLSNTQNKFDSFCTCDDKFLCSMATNGVMTMINVRSQQTITEILFNLYILPKLNKCILKFTDYISRLKLIGISFSKSNDKLLFVVQHGRFTSTELYVICFDIDSANIVMCNPLDCIQVSDSHCAFESIRISSIIPFDAIGTKWKLCIRVDILSDEFCYLNDIDGPEDGDMVNLDYYQYITVDVSNEYKLKICFGDEMFRDYNAFKYNGKNWVKKCKDTTASVYRPLLLM